MTPTSTPRLGVFRGLSAKTAEFATSYFVTGVVSVPVLAMVVATSADQGGGGCVT